MSFKKKIKKYSLFIEGATAAGGGAIFKEGPCEFLVQIVRHWSTDSLPCQDEDHQHGIFTVVPRPLADQTQQLLLFAATPDHLLHDTESKQVLTDDRQQCNTGKARNKYFILVSRNYRPHWVMFATLGLTKSIFREEVGNNYVLVVVTWLGAAEGLLWLW